MKQFKKVALAALVASTMSHSVSAEVDEVAMAELKYSWDTFIQSMNLAREALDNPNFVPPESTERNLADGYRYLLGHLMRTFEAEMHQDPARPNFQRATGGMLSKFTIDNADTAYYSARIDPNGYYKITGKYKSKGPRVVSFSTNTGTIGNTGQLQELGDCSIVSVGTLTSTEWMLDNNGRFEILVGPEPDPAWDGDFIPSQGLVPCRLPDGSVVQLPKEATEIAVRQVFSDWENEDPMFMEITRLDYEGERGVPRNAIDTAAQLETIGANVANQIKFWSFLNEFGLEINGDRNGDGRRNLPLNDFNPAGPPFLASGTAGANQLYAAGVFEVFEGEALIVSMDLSERPDPMYYGLTLSNFWGESLEQANNTSSRNGDQVEVTSDGKVHFVVSHEDPGVANWLDTTALEKGQMTVRFVYDGDAPADPAQRPTFEVVKVGVDEVWDFLPIDSSAVSAGERRHEVAVRQEHIRKRYSH